MGIAYAQGQGGVAKDVAIALRWLRAAAVQGHKDATYNMVLLCEAQISCLEASGAEQALAWLQAAALKGMAKAAFEAGNLLAKSSASTATSEALKFFMLGARGGHAGSMYNAAYLMNQAGDITKAVIWFARAASQQVNRKVANDATDASLKLRRLWVQQAEAADISTSSELFVAARAEDERGKTQASEEVNEDELLSGWNRGARQWAAFEASFQQHASYDNAEAYQFLRSAMITFKEILDVLPNHSDSELLHYLLLSKLAEGAKTLARDESEIATSTVWLEELVKQPLCAELFAEIETQPSCFNDQLASAITMRRRMGDFVKAEELVMVGNKHPRAATKWRTSLQVPRVFAPHLEATPWWDASRFALSEKLEKAWASGAIAADLARVDEAVRSAQEDGFQRIVSTGAPIHGASGADADVTGVWSEFMLFDGSLWLEKRCELASTLCALLRAAPEVAGDVVHSDGTITPPQGQVTIFRLRPGADVLPHVGVTNRRLILQFPLRGWQGVHFRVAEEWREYEEGKAMVFDDSFEHEVVHKGHADRYALYVVIHHPGLGTPRLRQDRQEL